MKSRFFAACLIVIFFIIFSGISFSDDVKETKGTVTKIAVVGYEITLKDEKGNEVKVKVKEIEEGIKVGDKVVIKNGKAKRPVKPITGGY